MTVSHVSLGKMTVSTGFFWGFWGILFSFTLWLFNIAMENGPFIDGLPIKNGDFPGKTLISMASLFRLDPGLGDFVVSMSPCSEVCIGFLRPREVPFSPFFLVWSVQIWPPVVRWFYHWLVVWNHGILWLSHHIWNSNPNWLIVFRGDDHRFKFMMINDNHRFQIMIIICAKHLMHWC